MKIIDYSEQQLKTLLRQSQVDNFTIRNQVASIIKNVIQSGDQSILEYTQKFDGVLLDDLRICQKEIEKAYEIVSDTFIDILKSAIKNIEKFHNYQSINSFEYTTQYGSIIGQKVTPIDRVAVYIPGGKAAYPSSVLMNVIPAKIAGVNEICLVSPPLKNGQLNPQVLVAADLLGIDEIYKVGGAQAVAACAYGCDSIKAVDKIVGPGNQYVTEAKRQVFGQVAIDMIAGPSEILILADENANPRYIARDLLSQSEHDEKAVPYLVTYSQKIIDESLKYLDSFINTSKRKNILRKSIDNNFIVIKASSIEEMIKASNTLAPEHLEILLDNPKNYLNDIKHAGSIFIGEYSPEPVGDYFAGPNHTLPTNQTARFSSPLGVYDFMKRSSYIEYSKSEIQKYGKMIKTFADTEKLYEHGNSIKERLNE